MKRRDMCIRVAIVLLERGNNSGTLDRFETQQTLGRVISA